LIFSATNEHAINAAHQSQAKIIFGVLLLIQIVALIIFAIEKFVSKLKPELENF
jgi:hypothetical protein